MIKLSYLSAIRFSGVDAGEFLHNQLSADVLALASGDSTFACYCEPRGRVLALMLVCRLDADYCVIMSSSLAATVVERLNIYIMRSKVNIEILNESSVVGSGTADKQQPPAILIAAIEVPASKSQLLVIKGDFKSANGSGAQDQWKVSEIQRGITWLCPETSGQFLPQMLGFDDLGAVNFRKGCYPGQEIVARTHYLGKVKRHSRVLCASAMVCPDPLDKIEIWSENQSYEAIIADCAHREDGGVCLFTVTRMAPGLTAETIEYRGQTAPINIS